MVHKKPASIRGTLSGGNPVPSRSDEQRKGVETCGQAYQVVLGLSRGLQMGEGPIGANGGHVTRVATNDSIAT